jgi:hypothetical protein
MLTTCSKYWLSCAGCPMLLLQFRTQPHLGCCLAAVIVQYLVTFFPGCCGSPCTCASRVCTGQVSVLAQPSHFYIAYRRMRCMGLTSLVLTSSMSLAGPTASMLFYLPPALLHLLAIDACISHLLVFLLGCRRLFLVLVCGGSCARLVFLLPCFAPAHCAYSAR